MDDFLIENLFEEQPVKKKKSKGFGSQTEDDSLEETVEAHKEVEITIKEPIIDTTPAPVKHHDHSIRPMRRTKPVPKRGEKAATQVRR